MEFYVKCRECNEKFESVDKVIEHENEGECDQCGKWLGCGTNMEKHKKREHEVTKVVQSKVPEESKVTEPEKVPSNNELAISTNEMAAPEMISKEVVQSNVPVES